MRTLVFVFCFFGFCFLLLFFQEFFVYFQRIRFPQTQLLRSPVYGSTFAQRRLNSPFFFKNIFIPIKQKLNASIAIDTSNTNNKVFISYSLFFVSMIIVVGPLFTNSIFISAPNTPVATFPAKTSLVLATKDSYIGFENSGFEARI